MKHKEIKEELKKMMPEGFSGLIEEHLKYMKLRIEIKNNLEKMMPEGGFSGLVIQKMAALQEIKNRSEKSGPETTRKPKPK